MHSESECSETEDVQTSIITALTYIFDIIYEEPDENWLFRTLSRGWFGSSDYFSEVREVLIDYILHNSRRFENHLPEELNEYRITLCLSPSKIEEILVISIFHFFFENDLS